MKKREGELARMRSLMFYHELKLKRIAKIKRFGAQADRLIDFSVMNYSFMFIFHTPMTSPNFVLRSVWFDQQNLS